MTISEMIEQLQEHLKLQGDIEVEVVDTEPPNRDYDELWTKSPEITLTADSFGHRKHLFIK